MRLLQRAAVHARNRGATHLIMTYVPENDALKHLAQRAGMHLVPDPEEPRAYLSLDPPTAVFADGRNVFRNAGSDRSRL